MTGPAHRARTVAAGLVVVVVACLAAPAVLVILAVLAWPGGGLSAPGAMGRLGVLAADAAGWVAWTVYVVGLAREVATCLRQPESSRGAARRSRAAGWVASMVLVLLPAGALVGSATAGAAPVPASVASSVTASSTAGPPAGPVGASSSAAGSPSPPTTATAGGTAEPTGTYTVQPGDCLAAIATRFYGDEGAWTTIWSANADEEMPTGRRFVDPNLIVPGQQLTLPGIAPPSGGAPGAASTPPAPTPPSAPVDQGPADPATGAQRATSAGRAPAHGDGTTASRRKRDHQTHEERPGMARGGRARHHRALTLGQATHGGRAPARGVPPWLPEAIGLGVSAVVAAALARRIRRTRAKAMGARGDDEVLPDPTDQAAAAESAVTPFERSPVLDWLELANRHLTTALKARGGVDGAPSIHLVRVGPSGVELLLDEVVEWAPGEFRLADEGRTWVLGAEVDRSQLSARSEGDIAWLPLLLPVGDDKDGTYLLHVGPGEAVTVDGEGAAGMLRAWEAAVRAWPWAEQAPVAASAKEAADLAPLYRGQVTVTERGTVAYFASPEDLGPDVAATVGAASQANAEAGFSVVTGGELAKIEPWGVVVRASSLSPEDAEALEQATSAIMPVPVAEGTSVTTTTRTEGPAPVEVKLLTFTPTIVGLPKELPSDRMMRIVELVAWVALHAEQGTTAAAMVDQAIAGATVEKTVYNIVASARSALGTDERGNPRMVTDRSTRVYRTSSEVSVDVLRFQAMIERGTTTGDEKEAAELCRAALDLIVDAPVGNGVGRFGWWSAQWEARVARLATKAARCLAELAQAGAVDVQTARNAIGKARLAAADDEELARVTIALEHWAGNENRVDAEWESACARAERIDPGSGPNEATEALYGAIRRRWQSAASRPVA